MKAILIILTIQITGCKAKEIIPTEVLTPTATRTLAAAVPENAPTAVVTKIATQQPVSTQTPKPEATKVMETLFKSEKYPWFGGFDLSKAVIDSGSYVLKDQASINLVLEKIMKAYAIQKEMTEPQFLEYLKSNNYKFPALGFTSDDSKLSIVSLKREVVDLKRPLKISFLENRQSDGSILSTDAKVNYGSEWCGLRVNNDGSLEFILRKDTVRWYLEYDSRKWGYASSSLRMQMQFIASLKLYNEQPKDFWGNVYKAFANDPTSTIPSYFTREEFVGGSLKVEDVLKNAPLQFVGKQ